MPVWGAEGRGGIRLHGLDSCGGQDRGSFVVSIGKGRAGGTFGGIGNALGLVGLVRLSSTGEEGAAVEPIGLVFGRDAEEVEGSEESDVAGLKARFAGDAAGRATQLLLTDVNSSRSACSRARRLRARSLTTNSEASAYQGAPRKNTRCYKGMRGMQNSNER